MVVEDASTVVVAVIEDTARAFAARAALREGAAAPHLVDAEIGQRSVDSSRGELDEPSALPALADARSLVGERSAHAALMERAWELRPNVTFYDGLYLALAEARRLPLLTADRRLPAAPGVRCDVQLVG